MSDIKLTSYKVAATIPNVQYGNIMPELTLEGGSEVEMIEKGNAIIKDLWRKYGMVPMTERDTRGEKRTSFTGEELFYNDDAHVYTDLEGNVLLSGSKFAAQFSPKFDLAMMLPKTAKAWGVDESELGAVWELNAKVSTEYGSSIHTALELWHRFKEMGAKVQEHKSLTENYALPKTKYLREIVLAFDAEYGTDAMAEVLISDVKQKRAGQIDRLAILNLEDKVCRVQDYKSNADLDSKKMLQYQKQMSFYAWILMAHGWIVEGLDIFHWNDGIWKLTELPVLTEAEVVVG